MSANVAVLDSSVFNKLYLDEPDRGDVLEFLDYAAKGNVQIVAPSLFTYEVLAVASSCSFGAIAAYGLIQSFEESGFRQFELDSDIVAKAIEISDSGNSKSGFPTFYDSAYHALAILSDGVFLTADARHVAKARKFGYVVLLKDWKRTFAA